MAKTIAIASSKGGTGKTTTALNCAVSLAERGFETVLVDLDPQGSVGLSLGQSDTQWSGLAEYLMNESTLDGALISTKLATLSLLPRGRLHAADFCEYEKALHSPNVMTDLVTKLERQFEYVIIDTPSGLGMITRAALSASAWIIAPLQAEPLALRSLTQLLAVVDHVRGAENEKLTLLGILPTMVQLESDASLDVMNTVWSGYGNVFDTFIPRSPVFNEASNAGIPVGFMRGRDRPEARRFDILVSEIEEKLAELGQVTGESDERPQRKLV